jgi:hypothetical protein
MSTLEELVQRAAEQNKELLARLAETDHARPALKQQNEVIPELEQSIRVNNSKLKQLDMKRRLELADHVDYRDSKVKKFFYKAAGQREKFDAKAEKEAREYFAVLQQQHEMSVLNDGLKAQLEQAKAVRDEMESLSQLHQDAQQQLDSLYHSIFGGQTPSFPEEDEAERRSNEALARYHDARVLYDDEARLADLTKKALAKVEQAVAQMSSALSASRMDIIGFDSADYMEHMALARAQAAISEARNIAAQARHENLPDVQIRQGSLVSDVIFDNIFTDMHAHEEIKMSQSRVLAFKRALQNAAGVGQDRLEAARQALEREESKLEAARQELQDTRQRLFEKICQENRS